MEPAGTIVALVPDSDAFSVCDGTFIAGPRFPDYSRRVGNTVGGAGIWLHAKPIIPHCSVRLADDPDLPDPPPGGWSIANPPPPFAVQISPVADVTTAPDALTAVVTAPATVAPFPVACTGQVSGAGYTGPVSQLTPDASGGMTVSDPAVPIGTGYAVTVSATAQGVTAQSNTFAVIAG
jgi:hypothetical protein